jgi:hypothetical protein
MIAGVFVCWWLAEFTDLFPFITTVLGLGGVLVWVGFVWTWVDEKKNLQKAIRDKVLGALESPWPNCLSLTAVVVILTLSWFLGTVRVENIQGGDVTVQINPATPPAKDDDRDRLPTSGERNYPHWMWPRQSAKVRVKVDNLPTREVAVVPLWRSWWRPKRLYVPNSFLRPVVVIGAESSIVNNSDERTQHVRVFINGNEVGDLPYDGRALLVGASDVDLPMPAGLSSLPLWKDVLSANAAKVMPPRNLDVPLNAGDKVTAQITDKNRIAKLNNKGKVQYRMDEILAPQPTDRLAVVVPALLIEHPDD